MCLRANSQADYPRKAAKSAAPAMDDGPASKVPAPKATAAKSAPAKKESVQECILLDDEEMPPLEKRKNLEDRISRVRAESQS